MIDKNLEKICKSAAKCFEENFPKVESFYQHFPKNYCEESCIILNSILYDQNIKDFKILKGSDNQGTHHYWLESDTLVIDLTAHQFEGIAKLDVIPKDQYPLMKKFKKNVCEERQPIKINDLVEKIKNKFYTEYFD